MDINVVGNKLDEYLKDRYGLKRKIVKIKHNRVIDARRAAFILYFRCWNAFSKDDSHKLPWKWSTLIIANVEFRRERRGEFEALLRFLVYIADDAGVEHIGIESTNEKSAAFAKKFGFTGAAYPKCYTVPISSLKERFEKQEAILA